MNASIVPVIDISPFTDEDAHDDASRARVAKQWDDAMTEIGFAIIQGHGVPPDIVAALRQGAMAFFAQDEKSKLEYTYGPYGNPLGGYTGSGTEAVSRTRDTHGSDGGGEASETKAALPDLVESFIFKPDSLKPKPMSLDAAGHAYHRELLRVLGCLHHLTAAALGLPRDFFTPFYAPHAEVSLRLAYYPPLSAEAQCSSAVRYGEHTDYTGFTILNQDESDVGDLDAGGLQVAFVPCPLATGPHLFTAASATPACVVCGYRCACAQVSGTRCCRSRVPSSSTSETFTRCWPPLTCSRDHKCTCCQNRAELTSRVNRVAGLDQWTVALNRPPSAQATRRHGRCQLASAVHPLFYRATRRRDHRGDADVRRRGAPSEVCARPGARALAEEARAIQRVMCVTAAGC